LAAPAPTIERSERLLPREDADVSEAMQELFKDEGIEIVSDAHISKVTGRSGEQVSVELSGKEKTVLKGSHLLFATGRTPNTENIGLDIAGVEVTERGYVRVNERLQTSAPGV